MKKKSPKYDLAKSLEARDEGLANLSSYVTSAWFAEARAQALIVALSKAELTTDDIWLTGLSEPTEPRAMGPVITSLVKDGILSPTGRFVRTARVSRHAAPIAIWKSEVYDAAPNHA